MALAGAATIRDVIAFPKTTAVRFSELCKHGVRCSLKYQYEAQNSPAQASNMRRWHSVQVLTLHHLIGGKRLRSKVAKAKPVRQLCLNHGPELSSQLSGRSNQAAKSWAVTGVIKDEVNRTLHTCKPFEVELMSGMCCRANVCLCKRQAKLERSSFTISASSLQILSRRQKLLPAALKHSKTLDSNSDSSTSGMG